MHMYDVICRKRDGGELTDNEIFEVINGYTKGDIPDYQMSALCMAIFYSGMNDRETAVLTDAMAKSGDTLDLSELGDKTVGKHSKGGVEGIRPLILLRLWWHLLEESLQKCPEEVLGIQVEQ